MIEQESGQPAFGNKSTARATSTARLGSCSTSVSHAVLLLSIIKWIYSTAAQASTPALRAAEVLIKLSVCLSFLESSPWVSLHCHKSRALGRSGDPVLQPSLQPMTQMAGYSAKARPQGSVQHVPSSPCMHQLFCHAGLHFHALDQFFLSVGLRVRRQCKWLQHLADHSVLRAREALR